MSVDNKFSILVDDNITVLVRYQFAASSRFQLEIRKERAIL